MHCTAFCDKKHYIIYVYRHNQFLCTSSLGGGEEGEDYRQMIRGMKWARKFSGEYMQFLDWLFAKCCLARDGVHWLLRHIAWIEGRGREELWGVTLLETFCHLPAHGSCFQVLGVLLGRLIDGFRLHCKCTFFSHSSAEKLCIWILIAKGPRLTRIFQILLVLHKSSTNRNPVRLFFLHQKKTANEINKFN